MSQPIAHGGRLEAIIKHPKNISMHLLNQTKARRTHLDGSINFPQVENQKH